MCKVKDNLVESHQGRLNCLHTLSSYVFAASDLAIPVFDAFSSSAACGVLTVTIKGGTKGKQNGK